MNKPAITDMKCPISMRTIYTSGLNKVLGLKFQEDYRVWKETRGLEGTIAKNNGTITIKMSMPGQISKADINVISLYFYISGTCKRNYCYKMFDNYLCGVVL